MFKVGECGSSTYFMVRERYEFRCTSSCLCSYKKNTDTILAKRYCCDDSWGGKTICKTGSDSETDDESDYDPETEPESESDGLPLTQNMMMNLNMTMILDVYLNLIQIQIRHRVGAYLLLLAKKYRVI